MSLSSEKTHILFSRYPRWSGVRCCDKRQENLFALLSFGFVLARHPCGPSPISESVQSLDDSFEHSRHSLNQLHEVVTWNAFQLALLKVHLWNFFPKNILLNINSTCKVLVPCFMSWNKISQKCSICTKFIFLSNFVHTFVYIPVSEHFSFAKIIHPPDRCGISRSLIFPFKSTFSDKDLQPSLWYHLKV